MSQRRPPIARRSLALACVLAVVAAGCSKSKKGDDASDAPRATTTTAPKIFPLTGRAIDDPAKAGRAAVAVKVDNDPKARPQAGLDKADLIYEEFTEGVTRFIVVYHSTDAELVGAVRSVRPADPVVVLPLKGLLVFSGGSAAVLKLVGESRLKVVDEDQADVMKRRPRPGKDFERTLFTSTQGLFQKAADLKAPPKFGEFLAAGGQFKGAGAVPITKLNLEAAPSVTAGYDWDAGGGVWKRSTDGRPHSLEGGAQLAPTNVIVQFTPYSQFSGDRKVQYPEVLGTGEAFVFAAGMMVKGRWTKSGANDVTTYTDSAGAPIALPPGQTFVHLVAPGSAVNPT